MTECSPPFSSMRTLQSTFHQTPQPLSLKLLSIATPWRSTQPRGELLDHFRWMVVRLLIGSCCSRRLVCMLRLQHHAVQPSHRKAKAERISLSNPFCCSTVGTSKTHLRFPPYMLKPAMAESGSGFTLQPCPNASDLATALMGGCGTDPRRSV